MSKSKELLDEAEKLFEEAKEESGYYYELQVARKGIELLKQSRTELLKEVEGIVDKIFEEKKYRDLSRAEFNEILKSKLKALEGE